MKRLYFSFGLVVSMCASIDASRALRAPLEELCNSAPHRVIRSVVLDEYKRLVLSYAGMFRSTQPLLAPFDCFRFPDPICTATLVTQKRWASTHVSSDLPTCVDHAQNIAFRKAFQIPENKTLLINFLNATLRRKGPEEITDIQVSSKETPQQFWEEEYSILEIFCTDKSRKPSIVKMKKDIPKWPLRLGGNLKRVQIYDWSIEAQDFKPVLCAVITDSKSLLQDPQRFISINRIVDVDAYGEYLPNLKWIFLETLNFANDDRPLTKKRVKTLTTDLDREFSYERLIIFLRITQR